MGAVFVLVALGFALGLGHAANAVLTCTHNAVADGPWGDAATWDTATVPNSPAAVACIAAFRTVTIDDTTGSVQVRGISGAGTLVMSDTPAAGAGGTLTLTDSAETSTIGALNISDGKLTGASSLTVNGPFTWTGGAVGATQTLKSITVTGLTTLGGGTKTIDNRRLALNGNTTWSSGDIVWDRTITSFSDQVITVGVGSIFDITASSDLSATGTNLPQFTVNGTLRKSGAAAVALLETQIDNAGAIEATGGKLTLGKRATGSLAGAGAWTSGSGATLEIRGGTSNSLAGPINGPGTVLLTAATTNLTGSFFSSPLISTQTAEAIAPAVTIGPGGSGSPGSIAMGSLGSMIISRSLSVPSLTQAGGTLGGSSQLATGSYDWSGGNVNRNGATTTVTGTTTMAGGSKGLQNGILQLNGGTTWTAGGVVLSGSGVMINNGLFGVNPPDGAVFTGGTFTNTATGVVRRAGTGRVVFGPALSNSGRVEVTSGTLALTGCYSGVTSAAWALSSGTTLEAALPPSLTCVSNFSGTLDGPGALDMVSGVLNLAGPITNAPAVSVRGGSLGIAASGTGSPGSINSSAGGFSMSRPLAVNSVTLSQGTLGNTSTLTVGAGGLAWSGGALGGGAATVNGPVTMTGGFKTLSGTLDLNSGATWSAGDLLLNNGTIRNNAGTFSIQGAVTSIRNSAATFRNLPGAVLDVDASPVVLDLAMDNDGTVLVDGASLTIGDTAAGTLPAETSTGTFTVGSGSTLTFGGGNHTLAGTLTGAGAFAVTGGTQAITGTLNSLPITMSQARISAPTLTLAPSSGGPGAVTVTTGTLTLPNATSLTTLTNNGTLNGAGALTVGTLTWTGGFVDIPTTVTGQATLTGSNTKFVNKPLTFNGAVSWVSGHMQIVAGSVLATDVFDVAATSDSPQILGPGAFRVTGTLTRDSATGTPLIAAPFDNDGVANVANGVLRVSNVAADSTGSFHVASGAGTRLEFEGADMVIPTALSGPGVFRVTQGTLTVTGAMVDTPTLDTSDTSTLRYRPASGTAYLSVPAGTLDVSENAVAAGLTLAGGQVIGDAELSTETLDWTSGEMLGAGSTVVAGAATLDGPAAKLLTQRALFLNGATTWAAGTLRVSEAVLTNNGPLDVTGNATRLLDRVTGSLATLDNGPDGVITRSGTGLLTLEGAVNNNGVVSAALGDIKVGDNSTASSSPGEWTIPVGRTVTFASASDTLSGVITGPGTVRFSAGTYGVPAILVDDPAFSIGGGTITLAPATGAIGALTVTGGTLLIPEDLSANAVTLGGGTITGAGDFTVDGVFAWQRGIMSGAATTTVNGPLALNTSGKKTLGGRTLATNGATTWSNGVLALVNGSITNAGDFEISAPVALTKSGTASFVNGTTGVLRRTGTGVATLASSITNSGTVTVNPSTTLSVGGGSGTLTSTSTGIVSGAGTILGTVSGGSVRPGASPGILTASNLNTTPAGSTVQIELGGTTPGTAHDKVTVSGQATLGGTLELSLVNGFAPTNGDTFTILSANSISGAFSNVVVPAGRAMNVSYSPTSVVVTATAAPLHHIALSPQNTAVLTGVGQAYTAEGFDSSNNSLGDITSSSTFDIDGSPCSANVCSSASPGAHTITVTSESVQANTALRVLTAQTYDVADYMFANSLTSAEGTAPALTDIGPDSGQPAAAYANQSVFAVTRPVRTFGAGGGLSLSPTTSVMPSASYTALVEFNLTTVSGFRKLIDFANGTTDAGLYVHDGKLQFKGLTGDLGTAMVAGTYHDVAISRDGAGNVELYLDGSALGTFADPNRLAVIDSAGRLRLFRDDAVGSASEHSAGAVARVRVFDHRLAPTAVPGLKTVALSTSNVTVAEGNGGGTQPVNVTIALSGASSAPVTVHWATADNSAVAAGDYVAASGDVTFAPGDLTKAVAVSVSRDGLYEANEALVVQLSNPRGAVLQDVPTSKATITLTNDDTAPTMSINDVSITEGNASTKKITFTVTLSAVSGKSALVDYATVNGTAVAGSDYTAAAARLTIPAGTTSKTFTVTIRGDTVVEPTEKFSVTLSNPVDASIADGTGIGTITNDD